MQTYTRKLQRMSNYSYSITIPKSLIDSFGWRERQKVEIVFREGKDEFTVRDWKPSKGK